MERLVEIPTADLIGCALDWAVGQALMTAGCAAHLYPNSLKMWLVGPFGKPFNPSADWSQGGPLVEQFNVLLSPPTSPVHRNFGSFDKRNGYYESECWGATIFGKERKHRRTSFNHEGSALIVAMRAIVQSELGDVVSVPFEVARP